MKNKLEKPSHEAKALSLFLMAFKTTSPKFKEKSKRINRIWTLVKNNEMNIDDYLNEVNKTIIGYGGYLMVVEKTVQHYIDKTGKWKLEGEDKYCIDAKEIANKILKK